MIEDRIESTVVWALVALLVAGPCSAITATTVGDSVVDPQALTIKGGFGQCINGLSFQQDAIVSHRGYQYVTYYDAKRHVCLALWYW